MKLKILQIVSKIPQGAVATYGQIALLAGFPRGARQVGWFLNSLDGKVGNQIPWWRVVNRDGRITIRGTKFVDKQTQRQFLRDEGVEVSEIFHINLDKFGWQPEDDSLQF